MKSLGVSIAVAAATLLFLTGCAGSAAPASAAGAWGTPDSTGQSEPGLNLGEDGKVSGNDGCNRVMGEWTETDGKVEFGALASTMMFCEGVDTWLLGATAAEVEGDSLVLFNEAGDEIGTLPRA